MSGKTAGLIDGRLRDCPDSPNCLCSQESRASHRTEPWAFSGEREAARQRLLAILRSLPRTRIETAEANYIHATCRSRLFRFVDDLELLIDDDAGLVHVRSASRVGWSDLGANARRVAALRAAFEALA